MTPLDICVAELAWEIVQSTFSNRIVVYGNVEMWKCTWGNLYSYISTLCTVYTCNPSLPYACQSSNHVRNHKSVKLKSSELLNVRLMKWWALLYAHTHTYTYAYTQLACNKRSDGCVCIEVTQGNWKDWNCKYCYI